MNTKQYTREQFFKDVRAAEHRIFRRMAKYYLKEDCDAYPSDYLYDWHWGVSPYGEVWITSRHKMNDTEINWHEPINFTNS